MNQTLFKIYPTCFIDDFGPSLQFWLDCMKTGAIYKKPYSPASIEISARLIQHFLKHLKPDFTNVKQAYIKTKMETSHLKPKSKVRLYHAVVSYVKSLVEGGTTEC